MYTDEIIEAVGGMSWFQIMLVMAIPGSRLIISNSMVMMSFAGSTPDEWLCSTGRDNSSVSVHGNDSLMACSPRDNTTQCHFEYSTERNTVINQWNLLCDMKHIGPTMTSVQMLGVLVGCLVTGHVAETIGRKKVFYLNMLVHALLNLVAAFSVSWQMFMSIRFFIGVVLGDIICVYYPYFMEFVGMKWRPATSTIPLWSLGVSLFGLWTWLFPDWSDLHILVAALHLPFFVGWFFVPESLRWSAVHGRITEAEKTVEQMARYNKRVKPPNTVTILETIAFEERKIRENGLKYSYLDIYKGWKSALTSITFQIMWFCVGLVYYGLNFGVGYLSGNIHLNIFLMAVIEIPGVVLCYFIVNKFGRRRVCFLFFGIGSLAAFTVAVVSKTVLSGHLRNILTTAIAFLCKMNVEPAWNGMQVFTAETYPTAIRNLGYGAANVAARVGSIISPYVFIVGSKENLFPPFMIVGTALCLAASLSLTLKETNGLPLEDTTANINRKTSLPLDDSPVQEQSML